MFDYIEYKDTCDQCCEEITSFQSKHGSCTLDTLQPIDVAYFNGYCDKCRHVQHYETVRAISLVHVIKL